MRGVIVRIIASRGFGFLRGEDNRSRFFHAKSVVPSGTFASLTEMAEVEFHHEEHEKGPRAVLVRLVK